MPKVDPLVKKVLEALEGKEYTIYVSSTGDDNNDGLSPDTPVKTLGKATQNIHHNCADVFIMDDSKIEGEKIVSKKPIEVKLGKRCLVSNCSFENVTLNAEGEDTLITHNYIKAKKYPIKGKHA